MIVDRIPIADRASWLALRQQDVTASVAGALLGVHQYTTGFELWALKSGAISEDPTESAPMRRGRLLEPIALQILAEDRPTWKVEPANDVYLRAPLHRIGATPDAFAVDPERPGRGVVQVKTTSDMVYRLKWKDPETGAPTLPLWIAVQAIVEAKLTGSSWACVALLVVGIGLELHVIDIPLHDGIWTRLVAEVETFWKRVETGDAPPADYTRDGETIAELWPPDEGLEPLDWTGDNLAPALVDERVRVSAEVKAGEERLAAIKAELTEKLAGATRARLADGRVIVRTMQKRGAFAVKATEFPVLKVKGTAA